MIKVGDKWQNCGPDTHRVVKAVRDDEVYYSRPFINGFIVISKEDFVKDAILIEQDGKPVEAEVSEVSLEVSLEVKEYLGFHKVKLKNGCSYRINEITSHERFIRFDWSNHFTEQTHLESYSMDSILYKYDIIMTSRAWKEDSEVIRPKFVIMRGE